MSHNFAICVGFIGKLTKKRYNAHSETLSSISREKMTTLSNFTSWGIASLYVDRCDRFVIDSNEGTRLCRSWFQRSEKRWRHIAIDIQRESCCHEAVRY
jgi:hypothetical protein